VVAVVAVTALAIVGLAIATTKDNRAGEPSFAKEVMTNMEMVGDY